jgi:hypothetical protein
VAYRAIVVRFINLLDACLLYGRGYHFGYGMVIFTYANIFTNYKDFFPWAARSTYYASWSCSRNKSTGGRWRCRTSSTTGSAARAEELATEGASEEEMSSLARVVVVCYLKLVYLASVLCRHIDMFCNLPLVVYG